MKHLKLVLLFFLISCGQPHPQSNNQEAIYPVYYSNSPVLLEIKNKRCSRRSFKPAEKFLDLHLLLNNYSAGLTRDFSLLLDGIFLRNGTVIAQPYAHEKVEINGRNKAYLRGNPVQVKICPGDEVYEPNTVESAALNSAYFINKAYVRFTSLFPEIPVSPIKLSISPSILHSTIKKNEAGATVKYSYYMTDNAFYSPLAQTITFLPQSYEWSKRIKYWQVPMVASHEYGHHLFEMINPNGIHAHHGIKECFGRTQSLKKVDLPGLGKHRNVQIQDVIDSYNEGFADLVAFYTLDFQEREISGIECLKVSRDVSSPTFLNGKPKSYNNEALQSYFSYYVDNSLSNCDEHSYQDSHVLGAIFAYSADSFLGELTDSEDEKLATIVEWVKLLKYNKRQNTLLSAQRFLESTISLFLKHSLEKFDRDFDEKICLKVNNIYPNLNLKECSDKKDL